MAFILSLFHRHNFVATNKPMLHACSCGKKRWGLFCEDIR
jgi:hypothetical protein